MYEKHVWRHIYFDKIDEGEKTFFIVGWNKISKDMKYIDINRVSLKKRKRKKKKTYLSQRKC